MKYISSKYLTVGIGEMGEVTDWNPDQAYISQHLYTTSLGRAPHLHSI